MSDLDNYVVGTVPEWFARQLVEKQYAIGESIEFPRIFAEDNIIVDYVTDRGWSIECVAKRGKAHRLIKEKYVVADMKENMVVAKPIEVYMEDLVVDTDIGLDTDMVIDDDPMLIGNQESDHDMEFMKEILTSERWRIIGRRRGRVNTYDEQRLEELDELLGPIVVPEKELKDYW